jgi:hypothetical protein
VNIAICDIAVMEVVFTAAAITKVRFIKTASGEELAILPRNEYERLAKQAADEDIGTARLVRGARKAITAGQEILVPKSVVDRLAAGENSVRVLREWRGRTHTTSIPA